MLKHKNMVVWFIALWAVCMVLGFQSVQATQLVGETAAISLSTTHPYSAGQVGETVASLEVSRSDATFIKVHFTNFELNTGDYVEVRDGQGILRQTITAENLGKSDFWAFSVDGSVASIALISGSAGQEAYGFDIDQYGYGIVPMQIESICSGTDDKVDIECKSGTTEHERAKSVGRMRYQKDSSWYVCTGFLISPEGHFLSNDHCVNNQTVFNTLEVRFNFQYTTCMGGNLASYQTFYGDQFMVTDYDYDAALMTLAGNPQDTYGYLELENRIPDLNEMIYIPQHPGGNPQKYDEGLVNIPVTYGRTADSDFAHQADTEGGSSGSPVLSKANHKVIGLHHFGGCDTIGYNRAVLMTNVYSIIAPYLPMSVFIDVPPGYWAEDAIYKIYEAGITTGCSQDPLMYCPLRDVSRAAMAVFLERGINDGNYTPPPATGIFDDVPVTHWAADWIEQLYHDGVTTGCGQNPLRYCPDRAVNRAAMAVFLLRSKHGSSYTPPAATGIFADVPVTHWAADWIEQLYEEGITTGCAQGPLRYCPDRAVRRDAMAVFLSRTFGF